MKLLYLTGSETAVDTLTTEQLARIAPQLSVTTVATAAEALVEIRRLGGFHALLTSPSLAKNETLALITSLRTDRVPIAIVPVVGEAQQDFFASAIGAGADDVLVLRGETLVQPTETLTRIRQSPHLFPVDDRRLRVLYAGSDPVVWDLLEQMPFVRAEQATCSVDGACPVRVPGAADGRLRCDVVLVDEKPNEAHPLQVVKSIKAQASDLPVIVLSAAGAADISTAAFDLGADDAVLKTSAYRRRLVATLRRVHQRLELTAQHASLREREGRLRQIVETMPEGLTVISGDGTVLAINAAGLAHVGAARPRELVGRDFCLFVAPEARAEVRRRLEAITAGEPGVIEFEFDGLDQVRRRVELRGVRLDRDARGVPGVIGTLRPAPSPADLAASAVTSESEGDLEAALAQAEARVLELIDQVSRAERREHELDAALAAERSRWEGERAALDARARQAQAAAAALANLESALEATRAELSRTDRVLADERAAWHAARLELETRLADQEDVAARTQAELEEALGRAQAEAAALAGARESGWAEQEDARRALEARLAEEHGREREQWEDTRRTLESRLSELRVAWDTARQQLEARREAGRSDDATRADLEALLDSARADVAALKEAREREHREWQAAQDGLAANLRDDFARARDEWDEARRYLESRCEELLAEAAGRSHLQRDLDAARAEAEAHARDLATARAERVDLESTLEAAQGLLRQTTLEHKADRARWEAERRALEAELQRTSAAASSRAALEAAVEALRRELQHAAEAHQADRAQWDEGRADLEARLAAALHSNDGRGELERALAEARTERDDTRAALDAERARLVTLEGEIGRLEAAHAAEREAWDGKRRDLESRLVELEAVSSARASLEATVEAVQRDLHAVRAAHESDRAAWDHAREAIERERHEADQARQAERDRADAAERATHASREEIGALERERHLLELERARLDDTANALRAAHADLASARTAALAERDEVRQELARTREELDQVRRKLEQEHTRRTLLEAAVREARREAEGRLAAVEAELASVRTSLEAELRDTTARLERATEDARLARERLEDGLAAATVHYDRLLETGAFGHALMTPDGLLVRCNDAFAHLFGYLNAGDALARTAGRPFPGLAGRPWVDARLAADGRVSQLESNLERIDGRLIRVVESAALVTEPSGEPRVERVLIDRTGSLAQDERLRHAARLEEIGTLAAAMAPDIESLMASVVASGSALAEALSASDARREHTARILSHASQAADLVRQLAAFSLKQVRPTEFVDLADAIRRSERLLRPLLGPHISLKVSLGRSDAVAVAQDDLDQLLSALVVAGRDLLPIGGALTIDTARVDVDAGDADTAAGLRPGAHLRLSVTASGYGVQPAQRTAALDAVAARCGGHLRVAGEAGRSASFRVYFSRRAGMTGPIA